MSSNNQLMSAFDKAKAITTEAMIHERPMSTVSFASLLATKIEESMPVLRFPSDLVIIAEDNSVVITWKGTKRMEWTATLSDDEESIKVNGYAVVCYDKDDVSNKDDYTYLWLAEMKFATKQSQNLNLPLASVADYLIEPEVLVITTFVNHMTNYFGLFDQSDVMGLAFWFDASTLHND